MPLGQETPRARRGGCSSDGGRSLPPSHAVCAEPLRLEGSPKTRAVLSSGAGPSQNGMCSGGGIGRTSRAGRSTANYIWLGRTRVCITPISLHRVKEWVFFGQNRSKESYHGASQSGTWLGGSIDSKIRAGENTINIVRAGGPESIYASQTAPSERKEWVVGGGEL